MRRYRIGCTPALLETFARSCRDIRAVLFSNCFLGPRIAIDQSIIIDDGIEIPQGIEVLPRTDDIEVLVEEATGFVLLTLNAPLSSSLRQVHWLMVENRRRVQHALEMLRQRGI
jgi:hypothetical protein